MFNIIICADVQCNSTPEQSTYIVGHASALFAYNIVVLIIILPAVLQYCDLWKATVRREKRLLRDNVDAVELYEYFPYMNDKVKDKVKATANLKGKICAMDVLIDDGLMYVGELNPCYMR